MTTATNNLSFGINEDISKETFYFCTDDTGNLIKLGDGTFGVVYKVYNKVEGFCAAKLLYDNQANTPIYTIEVSANQILESFINKCNSEDDKELINNQKLMTELGDTLKEPIKNLGLLVFKLLYIGLSDKQSAFILEQIDHFTQSVAVKRFKSEMKASQDIQEALGVKGRGEFDGVVKVRGGTEVFKTYPAFENLEGTFKDLQIKVSNYALVMPLYDTNLKDLLEKGPPEEFVVSKKLCRYAIRQPALEQVALSVEIPSELKGLFEDELQLKKFIDNTDIEEQHKDILKLSIYERVGYDLLKEMVFEDRISVILPYLLDITQGLKALHMAKIFHYDLKPSNIFIKLSGNKVQAVIGDLGFLENQNFASSTRMSSSSDILPLGTRHYRSPEQKDYFDVCDVEVAHQVVSDNKEKEIILLVHDPKFQDSIIEEGDFIVFSKDSSRWKYDIASIGWNSNPIIIKLTGTQNELVSRIKPDKRTQVVFYKKQAYRTDLFGLGAIAFDMLTCGQSPERFYDNIRSFDTKDGDVNSIMELYRHVYNFQSNRPELTPLFDPFKHQYTSDYAPEDIVKLILKCMLYKAKNTFYNANFNTNDGYKPVAIALDELNNLERNYDKRDANNPLVTLNTEPSRSGKTNILVRDLDLLQRQKLPSRLAEGIWHFKKLVDLVLESVNSQRVYFSEMLPENIIVKSDPSVNRMDFNYNIYKSDDEYKSDLKEDGVYKKFTKDITNPFVPDYFTFMRRRIRISEVKGQNLLYKYTFLDSSLYGSHIGEGDWIVVNNQLWVIKPINGNQILLEPDKNNTAQKPEFRENQDHLAVYYKNLDPCTYYQNMLGIHLYHIFFVGIEGTSIGKDKPMLMNIAHTIYHMNSGKQLVKVKNPPKFFIKNEIESIYQALASLYLKLTFPQDMDKSPEERILSVSNHVNELRINIEQVVEEPKERLNRLIKFDDSKLKSLETKFATVPRERLDFSRLALNCLELSLPHGDNPISSITKRFGIH